MKALSVRQPWAGLIASGRKTIECRSWTTKYRGDLVIAASGRADKGALRWHPEFAQPIGVTLAVVELYDVRVMTEKDFAAACADVVYSEYAWCLRNVRPLPHVPVKGRLSLWDLPNDVAVSVGLPVEGQPAKAR